MYFQLYLPDSGASAWPHFCPPRWGLSAEITLPVEPGNAASFLSSLQPVHPTRASLSGLNWAWDIAPGDCMNNTKSYI